MKLSKSFIKKSFFAAVALFLIAACAQDIIDIKGTIHGVVKDATTGDLISNCQVSLSPGGKSAVTGSDGLFSFEELEAGTYVLTFSKDGYEKETKSIIVVSGEDQMVSITLKAVVNNQGGIKGIVKDANTGNLIANCQVSLSPGGKSLVTGADGFFEFINLDPDTYKLSFSKAGYEEETKSVNVKSGETTTADVMLNAKSAFALSSSKLDFGDMSSMMELYLFNNSDEICSFNMKNIPNWATISHTTGSVKANSSMAVVVNVNRDAVDYGTHTHIVNIEYKGKNSGSVALTLQMQKVLLAAPTVNISEGAEDITKTNFIVSGEIVATGGATITAYGHCWAPTHNPTIQNAHTDNGTTTDIGMFKSNVSGLSPATTYFVRAYATNQYGTAYSSEIAVTTEDVANSKWDGTIASSFAGGSGSKIDPYIIETGGQLMLMKDYSSAYFELANDIDLDNKNWLPFEFGGTLDGKGCIISNLYINRSTNNQGLFSTLSLSGGTIMGSVSNLTIRNVNINAPQYNNIGTFAGSGGKFSNCTVILTPQSQIAGSEYVGGMVGYQGSFTGCTVKYEGTKYGIKGTKNVGGINGYGSSVSGSCEQCHVEVNLIGEENVGGICGYGYFFKDCSFKGQIEADSNAGGIVGCTSKWDAYIYSSKADVVISSQSAGGIVGYIDYSGTTIKGCYSIGIINSTSTMNVGGIIGYNNPYMSGGGYKLSYSYSMVTSSAPSFDGINGGKGSPYGSTYDGDIVSCTSVTPTRLTDGNCRDIITFFREQYSSECDQYWNYDKTWTWSGTIDGQQVKVSCPRLKWE